MKYTAAILALLGSVSADGTDLLYAETRNSGSSEDEKVFTAPMTPTGGSSQNAIDPPAASLESESSAVDATSPGDDILYAETRSSDDDEDRVFTETSNAVGVNYDEVTNGVDNEIYEVEEAVLSAEESPVYQSSADDLLYAETRNSGDDDEEREFTEPMRATG